MPAAVAGDAGSVVRCPRCAAVWVSRPGDEPLSAPRHAPPLVERGPLTIEGGLVPAATPRRRRVFGRAGFAATAVMVALALAAIVTLSPDVSARSDSMLDKDSR